DSWQSLSLLAQASENACNSLARGRAHGVELGEKLGDRHARGVTCRVAGGRKRSRSHPIDVERPVQVIDLVLEDPRVPAAGFDLDRRAAVIESLDRDCAGARHHRLESVDAEAALEELDRLRAE